MGQRTLDPLSWPCIITTMVVGGTDKPTVQLLCSEYLPMRICMQAQHTLTRSMLASLKQNKTWITPVFLIFYITDIGNRQNVFILIHQQDHIGHIETLGDGLEVLLSESRLMNTIWQFYDLKSLDTRDFFWDQQLRMLPLVSQQVLISILWRAALMYTKSCT